jgi:hypothetical protein
VKPIGKLKDIHKGHDIYVVASGASADFIDQTFFDNKLAIFRLEGHKYER